MNIIMFSNVFHLLLVSNLKFIRFDVVVFMISNKTYF